MSEVQEIPIVEGLRPIEAVRGLTGQWHLTFGDWSSDGGRLKTLCRVAIPPNHRRFKSVLHLKLCPECRMVYNKRLTALNQGIEALEFRQCREEQEGEKGVFVETKRLIGATYSFDDPWKGDEHYESI